MTDVRRRLRVLWIAKMVFGVVMIAAPVIGAVGMNLRIQRDVNTMSAVQPSEVEALLASMRNTSYFLPVGAAIGAVGLVLYLAAAVLMMRERRRLAAAIPKGSA